MSAYEGSKMQERDEYLKKNVTFNTISERRSAKQQKISELNETSGYSDTERVKSFIEVYEKANQLNVVSFMQWCDKEDWHFERPIKNPNIKL